MEYVSDVSTEQSIIVWTIVVSALGTNKNKQQNVLSKILTKIERKRILIFFYYLSIKFVGSRLIGLCDNNYYVLRLSQLFR